MLVAAEIVNLVRKGVVCEMCVNAAAVAPCVEVWVGCSRGELFGRGRNQ
jgi:hypothetical protein